MSYSQRFFRSHPHALAKRRMDKIEKNSLNPLNRKIRKMETKLAILSRQQDQAFARRDKKEGTRLDQLRSTLAGRLAILKEEMSKHQQTYNRLQRSMTPHTPLIWRKRFLPLRRAV